MPNTRKKVIKTVYKDEDDSEAENAAGDFSDSGSEVQISEQSSSEDDEVPSEASSVDDFVDRSKKSKGYTMANTSKTKTVRKTKFTKTLVNKINKQIITDNEHAEVTPPLISVKDLSDADKLLPPVLNLSESDSSDDDSPTCSTKKNNVQKPISFSAAHKDSDSEIETQMEYKDVWSTNIEDHSEEIAKIAFLELEQHKSKIEETKASISKYSSYPEVKVTSDVKDLLAQGEEVFPILTPNKKRQRNKKVREDSDSDIEDWEEVKESKGIPQQGLQLVVDIPDAICRKTKTLDIEMMMKRKINRVKKENQIYMHKVHVLCWIGHGNYVSRVLNDQEVLAAALSLVPSKECYPGERVDMKYVEQITTWFKDKLTLRQDKNEDKFRPKAPPLKDILLGQIKSRIVTTKKHLVFIFVSMLRALGLQCRVMFNFVALPIKPSTADLCSLAIKTGVESKDKRQGKKEDIKKKSGGTKQINTSNDRLSQLDGIDDFINSEYEAIHQLDGNDDIMIVKTRSIRSTRTNKKNTIENDDVSPPKRARKSPSCKPEKSIPELVDNNKADIRVLPQKRKVSSRKNQDSSESEVSTDNQNRRSVEQPSPKPSQNRCKRVSDCDKNTTDITSQIKKGTDSNIKIANSGQTILQNDETNSKPNSVSNNKGKKIPKIVVTEEQPSTSKYFNNKESSEVRKLSLKRNRSQTSDTSKILDVEIQQIKSRARSAPGKVAEKSKYFSNSDNKEKERDITQKIKRTSRQFVAKESLEDEKRVSHRDLISKSKTIPKNDVTSDLVDIIKNRVKEAKIESKKGIIKGKNRMESDEDSDYLLERVTKRRNSESGEEFKTVKINPRPSTSRKIDRRVLSSEDDTPKNKIDVWCEVFVEELEQWISVDVIKGKAHCAEAIYSRATHPVCYAVGWDNNNYMKDLTRRYVPHWNTVTRKQRVEPHWWDTAVQSWLSPNSPRNREEDEQLNRMQLEAPLPKSIAEYKNHPLYALKRHLLKFEAIYPADAATLGFVRREAVYARECVYVCRSRDTWLKEAKVVRLGEQPYKIVKARPKWDRLSNKLITDKPLEVFGPWQVQDYEPPEAENGVVPRNAYGNVELFKDCMLPKGTVHIKLPGLNKVAKKLNIDCAPAMTGFDFNGGWTHPVFDGFIVCKEFEEVITEAWIQDQEEQERKEIEKTEARVYGNWRRLIKGLFIRERLKNKYGFEEPSTTQAKKAKAPRLVVKKKH